LNKSIQENKDGGFMEQRYRYCAQPGQDTTQARAG
jgi:hypothetical protein